ncbi:MAG: VTT domain-containing protein [Chloroflexi bacterium]|nr:VTT domain-containing protein [Chloroflexota bacterium]
MNLDRIAYRWWILLGLLGLASLAWYFGPDLWRLLRDRAALEMFVRRLGWMGPLVLVLLNAAQIIIAPIPGYMVQLTAGFLYGPIWGGVWASCGLLLGSMSAMWLARSYGRPLVGRIFGKERLRSWDKVTTSTHTLVWLILLVTPIGDLPYFLAGLARVSFLKIALLTMMIRVPGVFVSAAIGAGVIGFSWWQIVAVFVTVGGILLILFSYQERILAWLGQRLEQEL